MPIIIIHKIEFIFPSIAWISISGQAHFVGFLKLHFADIDFPDGLISLSLSSKYFIMIMSTVKIFWKSIKSSQIYVKNV